MMKKYLILLVALCVFGCAESGVKNVLNSYFIALSMEDYETAYDYLSYEDKEDVNYDAFKAMMSASNWFKNTIGTQANSYTIISVDVTEDKAVAYTEIISPDVAKNLGNEISAGVNELLTGEQSAPRKTEMKRETKRYRLRKENGVWKVRLFTK